MTFSLPNDLARRFLASVPDRERSKTVARLLEGELSARDSVLAAACIAANADAALNEEMTAWQTFDHPIDEPWS